MDDAPRIDPLPTVPYLMDVHGLSCAEAYLVAQRHREAMEAWSGYESLPQEAPEL